MKRKRTPVYQKHTLLHFYLPPVDSACLPYSRLQSQEPWQGHAFCLQGAFGSATLWLRRLLDNTGLEVKGRGWGSEEGRVRAQAWGGLGFEERALEKQSLGCLYFQVHITGDLGRVPSSK